LFIECFWDSSLIIEAFKGNKNALEIISAMKSLVFKKIYINGVVWSETVFQLCIKRFLKIEDVFLFLDKFFFLNIDLNVIKIAKDLYCSQMDWTREEDRVRTRERVMKVVNFNF